MAKESSGRSSIAGSVHALSPPRENGDETSAQEPELSPETNPGFPDSGPFDDQSNKALDEDTPNVGTAESQPMTASNSASSNPSTKDVGSSGAGSAIPYGTRSRNRTGASRPNYAEDKELDAEFEVTSSAKESIGRKVARTADPLAFPEAGRATHNARKDYESDPYQTLTIQSHYKEPIPGTSTFSANPAVTSAGQSSKKRKAGVQLATSQAQQPMPTPGVPAVQAITRRASMAAQAMAGFRETNMLTFENCACRLKNKRLMADDGTVLEVNDHAYLVCEPPGEPYYLGRIMEFLHVNNDPTQPIDALRLNWYYRPKDIGRKVNDTRQVFASMHSDISPLTALRGKCQIKHKSEVDKLDDLRKSKDCFWYEKLYDRYIHRFYDVIPTNQVINVPVEVKKVLDERWRYIVVEPGRGKELTSAVKSCKRCNKYCASNDSVDCAVCQNTYHMSCVSPPLQKKPSRGFAWACGPCSKAQEKKLEARNTPNIIDTLIMDHEEEEFNEEEDPAALGDALDTGRTSPTISSEAEISFHPGTAEQIHQASLWLFRYLGIHCKVEDALDYDDRIYPRASSRLGPRHQANVPIWPGRPVEYVKPAEIKKKYVKGNGKKDAKFSKETIAALEADKIAREKRPKWIMDEPLGYVHRGEDHDNDDPNCTAQLLYKLPEAGEIRSSAMVATGGVGQNQLEEPAREQLVFDYMCRAARMAKSLGLPDLSTNLLDVALQMLVSHEYNVEKALDALAKADRKIFKEPELSPPELKKFEDGVSKFGSEWHSIKKHVKTMRAADVVRFYYTWKKTERGKQVWGNYSGRKGKKEAKKAEAANAGKLQDDVADEYDDSAFDNDKAYEKKRGFQCKFCSTRSSRQWRRAPNTPAGTMVPEIPGPKPTGKDKSNQLMVALCRRCAELWRRYAIQWEDIDEMAKKVAQAGGRAWKRKIDEELLKELEAANEVMNSPINPQSMTTISAGGTPAPTSANLPTGAEPPRKKLKGSSERDSTDPATDSGGTTSAPKKKVAPEKPTPVQEIPPPKTLPCAICGEMEPMGDQHLTCKECRMTVHRNCYGVVSENRSPTKWLCDMCSNDKNPQVSIQYKCMLCPVEYTEHDFVEPPKISHKKKTEKERERDRVERENAQKLAEYYRKRQEEMNKPVNPREPLKRTANNNWVHVTCAVFTPEVKFGKAKALEPSEGIPSIASARYEEVCKVCKKTGGACVGCHTCRVPVHVECAHQAGYILGFDIAPVKGSRRDQFNIVNIAGETGTMTAAIWCKEHVPTKTIVHRMYDIVDETGLNALQLYVQNFKQADLALTGTVRKATLVNQSTKVAIPVSVAPTPNRRTSTTTGSNGYSASSRNPISNSRTDGGQADTSSTANSGPDKICVTCHIDVSPKWWPFPADIADEPSATYGDSLNAPNSDHTHPNDLQLTNGHGINPSDENPGVNVALAAAALHQNTEKSVPIPTEFQCHQCHWRKLRKEPTPPSPEALGESSRPPTGTPLSNAEADPAPAPTHYAWPAPPPPSYPSNGSYSAWPHHSPVPQGVSILNQLNGNQSPRISTGPVPPLNGQPSLRQSAHGLSHSPHQNGHLSQGPNGYPHSSHRSLGSSTINMQNGIYPSYASTRPSPQHLTNGGPPPRAPEHPFSQSNGHMHPRSSFGPLQGSPPLIRDTPQGRDASSSQNNSMRPNEGRVNGGASASPSLRNLLS